MGAAWLANYAAYYPGYLLRFDSESEQPHNFSRWFMAMKEYMTDLNWPEKQLLSDVFGNPFHPVSVDSSWLTSTVLALATGIYSEKAFDHLPILADALQDAGCDNDDVLNHLRGPGPHVRGCWALDLVLNKS
jgi:hypothetical protein